MARARRAFSFYEKSVHTLSLLLSPQRNQTGEFPALTRIHTRKKAQRYGWPAWKRWSSFIELQISKTARERARGLLRTFRRPTSQFEVPSFIRGYSFPAEVDDVVATDVDNKIHSDDRRYPPPSPSLSRVAPDSDNKFSRCSRTKQVALAPHYIMQSALLVATIKPM